MFVLSTNKEVHMATDDRGFASMPEEEVKKYAGEGGKATGGKNLSRAARAKGGKRSHSGGNKS
jgi:hypothetical protein